MGRNYYENKQNKGTSSTDLPDKEVINTDEETTVEPVESVEDTLAEQTTVGIVDNCTKLNLRSTPAKEDNIITTLAAGTAVVIDADKSTNDFYKVTTESGVEGYCMKQFVRIAQ